MDGEEECMTKVAFCFPGQGSLEVGMGREIAEAVPEAMEVYRVGSEATGMDLAHLCFEAPLEELVETEVQQPTLVATSLAILAAVRKEGIEPDIVVGHSVGEFAALASVRAMSDGEAIGLVRERGLAMAEAARQRPGAMAANGFGPDDAHSRTVDVDAFCSWSACRMKMRSSARTSTSFTL
jgi:[acyl-carrier-protein] S-malonyltransferase